MKQPALSSVVQKWLPLLTGAAGLLFLSPKWLQPVFAWLAPGCLLWFSRTVPGRGRWVWMLAVLYVSGLLAAYEVAPMPVLVLAVLKLIDAFKLLLVYAADRWISRRFTHFAGTLFFPAAMVVLEFLAAQGGGGVWSSMANTQAGFAWLAQWASVTGVWGISFLVYWWASVAVWVVQRRQAGSPYRVGYIVFGSTFSLVLLFGAVRYHSNGLQGKTEVKTAGLSVPLLPFLEQVYQDETGRTIHLPPKLSQTSPRLQQANAALISFLQKPDEQKFSRSTAILAQMHDSLFSLSQKAADRGAKIISWTEGNGFVVKKNEAQLIARGKSFAAQNKVYLLMAVASFYEGRIEQGKKLFENKALLIGPDGTLLTRFLKNKPVPFAEPSVAGNGHIPVVHTPYGRLAVSICYDADFPQLMRQLGRQRADLLLLPSGDWRAISPYHSYMAVLRAIENGVSLVRPVNGGLSLAADYRGKISSSFDFYQEGEKLWIGTAVMGHVPTVYTFIGDGFGYGCLVLVMVFLAVAIRKVHKEQRQRKTAGRIFQPAGS